MKAKVCDKSQQNLARGFQLERNINRKRAKRIRRTFENTRVGEGSKKGTMSYNVRGLSRGPRRC